MDQNPTCLDPPGTTWTNEDDDAEESPSKENVVPNKSERGPYVMAPNSARKRRPGHTLSRATLTPSHGVKMSGIFQNAAATLENCYTSPTSFSSNTKRLRKPIQQARMGPFGHTGGQVRFTSPQAVSAFNLGFGQATDFSGALTPPAIPWGPEFPCPLPTRQSSCDCPKKPISSSDEAKVLGQSNRARQIIAEHRENVRASDGTYPKINQRKMRGFSSTPSSLSSDCHSSHGVPVVMPISSKSRDIVEVIDTWLSEVHEPNTVEYSDDKSYTPQSSEYNPHTPQSPDHKSYASQSLNHDSNAPQSPKHDSYGPISPDSKIQEQQGSESIQNLNFKRSPKRPFTSLRQLPTALVLLPKNQNARTPMSAISSNNESSDPLYPVLPSTDAIPSATNHHRSTTPSPPPIAPRFPSQSLCPIPPPPSVASGPPIPYPSPNFSLGPAIPSITENRRRKKRWVRSPPVIPNSAPSTRGLTRQMTSSHPEEVTAVKELSPQVERFRKGYAPHPERRPSYWDHDILGTQAYEEDDDDDESAIDENKKKKQGGDTPGDGRKVRGESRRGEELPRTKSLIEGVGNDKSGPGA
ncbi:hypothetical protein MMC07_002847 [Pseudocyphellaria aurata]|nr:hypothetical protein [Pseudocyphellaria aurata]